MPRFCRYCGAEMQSATPRFCPVCGKSVQGQVSIHQPADFYLVVQIPGQVPYEIQLTNLIMVFGCSGDIGPV